MDSSQVKTAKEALKGLGYDAKVVSKEVDKVGASANKTANALSFLNRSIFTMKNLVGTVLATSILKSVDNMAMLRARIEQSTESSAEFAVAFSELKEYRAKQGLHLGLLLMYFKGCLSRVKKSKQRLTTC